MEMLSRHSAQRTVAQWSPGRTVRWIFDAEAGPRSRFVPRWIFLRALAVFYFSAFFSLLFQIKGLIGPHGVLPAQSFLVAVQGAVGPLRFWYAPTVFWISSGEHAMMAITWVGLIASLAAFCNVWPRFTFFVCLICFLSFVTAAQAFSSYQSDGMLLEAGFLALFFAPRGLWPGWGIASPPSRASLFLLQWEWFRIYFESGMVKLLSGDPQWRNYTAMDEYYQNGPLPTWIGWYVEHLPHWFHAATVAGLPAAGRSKRALAAAGAVPHGLSRPSENGRCATRDRFDSDAEGDRSLHGRSSSQGSRSGPVFQDGSALWVGGDAHVDCLRHQCGDDSNAMA
jgi:hypothetical protein